MGHPSDRDGAAGTARGASAAVSALGRKLQGTVVLLATGWPLSAALLAMLPAAIFARGFPPVTLPWKRTLAGLAVLILALIPLSNFVERPVAGRGAGRGDATPAWDGKASASTRMELETHRGIVLLPPQEKRKILIPPKPSTSRRRYPMMAEALRIPFTGVYWFFQIPYTEPPPLSLTEHGVPTERSYRATDRRSMAMEAHQHLGTRLEVSCCGALQVEISNGDPFG